MNIKKGLTVLAVLVLIISLSGRVYTEGVAGKGSQSAYPFYEDLVEDKAVLVPLVNNVLAFYRADHMPANFVSCPEELLGALPQSVRGVDAFCVRYVESEANGDKVYLALAVAGDSIVPQEMHIYLVEKRAESGATVIAIERVKFVGFTDAEYTMQDVDLYS